MVSLQILAVITQILQSLAVIIQAITLQRAGRAQEAPQMAEKAAQMILTLQILRITPQSQLQSPQAVMRIITLQIPQKAQERAQRAALMWIAMM